MIVSSALSWASMVLLKMIAHISGGTKLTDITSTFRVSCPDADGVVIRKKTTTHNDARPGPGPK